MVSLVDDFLAAVRRLSAAARPMVAAGASPDEVAQHLLRLGGSPNAAIRAVAEVTGVGQDEAKHIVHRNLDPAVRAAAERLWDEVLQAFRDRPDGGVS